jgi:hypothetical protein
MRLHERPKAEKQSPRRSEFGAADQDGSSKPYFSSSSKLRG